MIWQIVWNVNQTKVFSHVWFYQAQKVSSACIMLSLSSGPISSCVFIHITHHAQVHRFHLLKYHWNWAEYCRFWELSIAQLFFDSDFRVCDETHMFTLTFCFLQMFSFHFLTCFILCFYFLCTHEHMFYYGMCTVPNVQKQIIIIIIVCGIESLIRPTASTLLVIDVSDITNQWYNKSELLGPCTIHYDSLVFSNWPTNTKVSV